FFFFQAEDGIRGRNVTGVQTCALPIWSWQSDFSNGHSRITAWVARFPLWKRSWRTVPVARCITNVSVCFIHLSKNSGESHRLSCVKAEGRTGKRGFQQIMPCPDCFILLLELYQYRSLKSF